MRNRLFIQLLACILCLAMVAEVSLPMKLVDAISIEMDSESEHEENSEKEKEKSTERLVSLNYNCLDLEESKKFACDHDSNWVSPAIDSVTPPPELS